MIKLGWALTVYLGLSFMVFLVMSNTINGWIIYFLLLLPFYGIVLLGWWIFIWRNHTKIARIKYWILSIVLVLQVATIVTSPGNCYGVKQGARCYSNLQILIGNVPSTGPSNSVHWNLVEDGWMGILAAYGVAFAIGLLSTSVAKSVNTHYK